MNDLSGAEIFVRVVDTGSFSAAARHLGVTPSAISRQISDLETRLGARLFHRTTRRQSLTEAGEIYLPHARSIANSQREAHLAVSRLSAAPAGTLNIAAEADFAITNLAPLLPAFLQRFPQVKLRFALSDKNADLIEGAIDVAIRFGAMRDSSLIAQKIGESRSLICAGPGYLARRGTPQAPADLRDHDCLSYRIGPEAAVWQFDSANGPDEVQVDGSVRVNSLSMLRKLALADIGLIVIPSWMVTEDLRAERLVAVLSDHPMIPRSSPIHAVYAGGRDLPPKSRAFIDFVANRLRANLRSVGAG